MTDTAEHDCGRARARLSEYVAGELSDEEKRAVDVALGTCPACRHEIEELRATMGTLSGLKRGAPPGFLKDVQRQIHTRSRGRFFSGRRFLLFGRIPFEWISLVMLLAMLAYYVVWAQSTPTGVTPAG
jgi:anti-sigma factor RsiW